MIMRSFNPEELSDCLDGYAVVGMEPKSWLGDIRNVMLLDDSGNVSLFEYNKDEVYTGHYYFKDRGKAALRVAREMLSKAFTDCDISVINGLTPEHNRGARWMSRQLGFNSYGMVDTITGPCELFILTKHEWELNNG